MQCNPVCVESTGKADQTNQPATSDLL